MSGDERDFNNIEMQAVIKFFPARQGAEGNKADCSNHFFVFAIPNYFSIHNIIICISQTQEFFINALK